MSNLSKTTWFTVLLAVLLCAVRMCAHASSRIEHIAEFYRHRDGFMGTVVVTRRGRIVFEKSYGYANVEKQLPFAQDTRFPIGSLSKQFTAAAILLLQQDGKLKTSDSVLQFYKDAPAAWRQITLRNLLTQTSGIPDFDFSEAVRQGPRPPEKNVQTVIAQPLKFEPGTAFDYSNINYVLLAMVIESTSGEPYCRFLQERIFEPLRLTQTGCGWISGSIPHGASGYRPAATGFVAAESDDLTSISGAGSLYSTTGDLIRWTSAMHGGRVLNRSSLKEMITPFLDGYAYGLEVEDHRRISHNGAIDGFYAAVDYLPHTKTIVLVLSNVSSDGNQRSPGAFAMEVELMESVLDQHSILPSEGKELFVPDETLRHYVGRYKATDSHNPVSFEISLNGNHLFFQLSGSGNSPAQLRAESKSDFYVAGQELEVDFDQSGSVLVTDYNGHVAAQFVRDKEENIPRLKP
jgi:CubicO group peptidase (beta-lactamase class C family)